MKKTKLLLVQALPSPYRTPFLEKLSNSKELDIHVVYMAKTVKNRIWKNSKLNFSHTFLPAFTIEIPQGDDVIPIWNNPTIIWEIAKGKYDLVICAGWDSITTFLARLACWLFNVPMVIWSGSTLCEKSWRRSFMSLPVKLLVNSCSALIAYGTAAKDYLLALGVVDSKIFISYNNVDVGFFNQTYQKNKSKRAKLKKLYGIKNKKIVLFVGQLISRKGPLDLYQAVKTLSSKHDLGVVWVGYGPLLETLKNQGRVDGVADQYFFTTKSIEETAAMYSLADVFVIPTYEDIYSNVVAEALASHVPVISTYQNGASKDLLVNGVNGFTINAGDAKALTLHLDSILSNEKLQKELSAAAWEKIKNFTYDSNVVVFEKLAKRCMSKKGF